MAESFFVDHMLGRLARWVRFMGFHAQYASPDLADDEIASMCSQGSLVLLSRDRELCSRVERSMYVRSVKIDEQLVQFVSNFKPDAENLMRICPVCDGDLKSTDRKKVEDSVPEKVFQVATEYWKCDKCGKVYWNGTHYDKIIRKISELAGTRNES